MMYSNNFVVSVLVDGKIVEERKDGTCLLPFNSEYTIRLRNKNSRRAVAHVYIDDEKVSSGGIVVNAYGYVDLERPVDKAVKFKFVSLQSNAARKAGKSNNDDKSKGVLKVDFQLEKEYVAPAIYNPIVKPWGKPYPSPIFDDYGYYSAKETYNNKRSGPSGSSVSPRGMSLGDAPSVGYNCSLNPSDNTYSKGILRSAKPKVSDGCTVDGSESTQRFTNTYVDLESSITTIMLVLKGSYDLKQEKVLFCEKCGTKRKNTTAKFCYNCGSRF